MYPQLLKTLAEILTTAVALTLAGATLRRRLAGIKAIAWPMAMVILGVVVWFLAAPDPRFGAGSRFWRSRWHYHRAGFRAG
jgi:hypothetical protein